MGNLLVIKGANFQANAITQDVIPEPDEQGFYPLSAVNDGIHGIKYADGTVQSMTEAGRFSHTNFVNVSGYTQLKYARVTANTSSPLGIAFYNGGKGYISGIQAIISSTTQQVYTEQIVSIPDNAVYARFTIYNPEYGLNFYAKGKP